MHIRHPSVLTRKIFKLKYKQEINLYTQTNFIAEGTSIIRAREIKN